MRLEKSDIYEIERAAQKNYDCSLPVIAALRTDSKICAQDFWAKYLSNQDFRLEYMKQIILCLYGLKCFYKQGDFQLVPGLIQLTYEAIRLRLEMSPEAVYHVSSMIFVELKTHVYNTSFDYRKVIEDDLMKFITN
jgi:hypothetical protein